jgi:hypothetical protein
MKRTVAIFTTVFVFLAYLAGCGPYRIKYVMPSNEPSGQTTQKGNAHGIGLGGGGFFFAGHQMLPALVNYSGPHDVDKICPDGFTEISHHQPFGYNALAAFITWLIFVNAYHKSTVEFHHAAGTEDPPKEDLSQP